MKVLNDGSLTAALETVLTEELIQEGIVRDMVRAIQNLRKGKGLDVTDRINLSIYGTEALKKAVQSFEDHLTSETLAVSWSWQKVKDSEEMVFGGNSCFVALSRVSP